MARRLRLHVTTDDLVHGWRDGCLCWGAEDAGRSVSRTHSLPDSSTSRCSPEAANWISHRSSVHPRAALGIPEMRTWLRSRPITSRIPRRGVGTSTKLGRHRWVVWRLPRPAGRLPSPDAPLRTLRPVVHRILHPRRDADLPPEANDVGQALILQRHFSGVPVRSRDSWGNTPRGTLDTPPRRRIRSVDTRKCRCSIRRRCMSSSLAPGADESDRRAVQRGDGRGPTPTGQS